VRSTKGWPLFYGGYNDHGPYASLSSPPQAAAARDSRRLISADTGSADGGHFREHDELIIAIAIFGYGCNARSEGALANVCADNIAHTVFPSDVEETDGLCAA